MSPDGRQGFGEVKRVSADLAEFDFVMEVEAEDARMIVCTIAGFAVFPACVIPERSAFITQTFEEALQVWLVEAPVLGEIFVVIRERDEAIFVMELCFMYAANRPLL